MRWPEGGEAHLCLQRKDIERCDGLCRRLRTFFLWLKALNRRQVAFRYISDTGDLRNMSSERIKEL